MPRGTTSNRPSTRPFTNRRAWVRVPAHCLLLLRSRHCLPLIRPRRACARIQVPLLARRCSCALLPLSGCCGTDAYICEQRALLASLSRPAGRRLSPTVRTVWPENIPVLLAAACARLVPTASPTVLSCRPLAPWAVQLANTLLCLLTRRKEIFPVLPCRWRLQRMCRRGRC